MRRSLSTLALVAMLTTSTSAFAGSPLWGYFVRDADGELVTAGWPKSKSIVFGSDEDADVRLDGLAPEHATVVADNGAIRIEPEVDGVLVDGRATDEAVTVHAGSTVTMGAYAVQFSLVRADYEPEPT
ncbi:MAG: FHA domain-containing protein [Deltaproteobacteria bacterium]